jgi:hypothetical protein
MTSEFRRPTEAELSEAERIADERAAAGTPMPVPVFDPPKLTASDIPAEIIKDAAIPNAWRVEKLDSDEDGGVDVTIFSGPNARERAAEYAAWKYGAQQSAALR